jgi:hypothetical protein
MLTSPRQAAGGISSGSSVVSSTGTGDKRVGAVCGNPANNPYANNYNGYNR